MFTLRHTLVGTAYFNAFSDGYIVGEFNEIPWQEMGDKDHYGPGNPGKRLPELDDRPIRLCAAPVLVCTWLLKTSVAYPLVSERPDNAVTFPLISWNGDGQILIFARPGLTGLSCELETQRS